MSSSWFDLDDSIASEFFDKTQMEFASGEKNTGTKKIHKTMEKWSATTDVNEIIDLAMGKTDRRDEKNKLLDSLLKDRLTGRNFTGRTSSTSTSTTRFSEEPHFRMKNLYVDDFFSDVNEKVSKFKNKYVDDDVRYDVESQKSSKYGREKNDSKYECKEGRHPEKSASGGSANSYAFTEVTNDGRSRKDSMDSTWSRKSNQGQVNFPSSASNVSEDCDTYSAQTIGRSISRDSDDSVCTEKSVNNSTISEKLPDGTDKTKIESNESWLKKSTSGSKISEKKFNDMTLTEKNDDGICEKSTTRMSYLEKSATGSSLKEEITSEKLTSSSSKGRTKTLEQKTSSEKYKKSQRTMPPTSSSSSYNYEDLNSSSTTYERFTPSSSFFSSSNSSSSTTEDRSKTSSFRLKEQLFTPSRTMKASEKISKLIDEAVYQDDLFKIPSSLQTNIDKVTDDFFNNSKTFSRDRARINRRRLTDILTGVSINFHIQ